MNIHHLELFYYVAKYEGITAATRKIPYGVQQPAVSGQILQLEKKLGIKLFNRRPFVLTKAGDELYDFIYPFFSRLGEVEERLTGVEGAHLRLAATASAIRNHLPEVLQALKEQEPSLKLSLREVDASDVEVQVTSQRVDLAIGVMSGRLGDGLKAESLLKIPLVLWVREEVEAKSWRDFLKKDPYSKTGYVGAEPLIGLPPHESLQQAFQKELDRLGVDWPVSVEVNSPDVVRDLVARGFGVGVGLFIPGLEVPEGIKAMPLKGFSPIEIGAIYQGQPKQIVLDFIELAKKHVKGLA